MGPAYTILFLITYKSSVHDRHDSSKTGVWRGVINLLGEFTFGSPVPRTAELFFPIREPTGEINRLTSARLKVVSNKIKTRYDVRGNSVGFKKTRSDYTT